MCCGNAAFFVRARWPDTAPPAIGAGRSRGRRPVLDPKTPRVGRGLQQPGFNCHRGVLDSAGHSGLRFGKTWL